MGRKKQWAERMEAPFPEGTFKRMDAVIKKGPDGQPAETRTDLVREAVERELKRREAKKTP